MEEQRKQHRFFKTETIYKINDPEIEIGKLKDINKDGAQILLNTRIQAKSEFKGFVLPAGSLSGHDESMELECDIVWENEFSGSSVIAMGVRFKDLSSKEEFILEGLVQEWTQEKMELQEKLPEA